MRVIRFFKNDDILFWGFVLLSVGIHLILFVSLSNPTIENHRSSTVEIDLTQGVRLENPKGRNKTQTVDPLLRPSAAKAREWFSSDKKYSASMEAAPTKLETETQHSVLQEDSNSVGSAVGGLPEINGGLSDLTSLSRLPQILNKGALETNLRRFYPESERQRRQEGIVTINIHLNAAGRVTDVEVVQSAGKAFDAAAIKVAKLLRFSPAYIGTEKVAVKIQQSIQFKLE